MNGFVKTIAAVCSVSVLSGFIFSGLTTDYSSYSVNAEVSEFGVESHTQEEIIQYAKQHSFNLRMTDTYAEEPNTSVPYSLGRLSDESLENGINCLNVMRYVAGLDEVVLDENYITLTQAASVVNAGNNSLSHYPVQPSGMSDEMYAMGKEGAGSSNIGWGYGNVAESVINGYMDDSDSSNIDRLGHRRWCLNPNMKKTGFGHAGAFTAMYSFDNIFTGNKSGIVRWPAENMPVQYFDDGIAWSISFGRTVDANAVSVNLTRKSDNTVWNFSAKSSDGYFNVNNDNYGQPGCIIFRPESIKGGIKSDDVFTVEITGATENPLSYTVNFFDLNGKSEPAETTETTTTEAVTTTTEDTTSTEETHIYYMGDLNGDEYIDIRDLLILKKYILGQVSLTEEQMYVADLDSDFDITILDVVILKWALM